VTDGRRRGEGDVGRILGAVVILVALQSCAGTSQDAFTSADVGLTVDLRSAPPPPPIRWDRRPDLREIRGSSVYLVEEPDYDVFMYGGAYYCYANGYWYRADSDQTGFLVVDSRSVPPPVLRVPSRHWRHRPAAHRHGSNRS